MIDEEQIRQVITFLKIGKSFKIGNLKIGAEKSNSIYIVGWSNYNNIENLTKKVASKELAEIKLSFKNILEKSEELKEFLKSKTIEYNLAFNYGQGSIGICTEKEGRVKWEIEL
jgi:hypothetical protein